MSVVSKSMGDRKDAIIWRTSLSHDQGLTRSPRNVRNFKSETLFRRGKMCLGKKGKYGGSGGRRVVVSWRLSSSKDLPMFRSVEECSIFMFVRVYAKGQ